MNQTEQVARITLEQQVALQDEHIRRLETRAILNEDKDQRLQIIANAAVIREHSERIERLEVALALQLTAGKIAQTQFTATANAG